jgi:hypothetical protein
MLARTHACSRAVLVDDLGDNLLRVDRIRDLYKRAKIICRAFHEDAAEVLTRSPFDCIVLSTSRYAADSLARAGVFREVGIDEPDARTRGRAVTNVAAWRSAAPSPVAVETLHEWGLRQECGRPRRA